MQDLRFTGRNMRNARKLNTPSTDCLCFCVLLFRLRNARVELEHDLGFSAPAVTISP